MTITKQVLKEVILDQRQLSIPEFAIPREGHASVKQYFPQDVIVIITGLRRCGKSTLLQYIRKEQAVNDYYFNFDDERLATFTLDDFQKLYELFIEMFGEQDCFYFDEIQNIKGWERFVRRLHDYGAKILITGSNATMLSQELGTRLTGRYRQIELYPFSFKEFLQFKSIKFSELESTLSKATALRYFNCFLFDGGIPAYSRLQDIQYLSDLYEGIIYRDVVVRYGITKISELKSLVYHAASNTSKLVTYSKLQQMLSIKHSSTVKDYLHYLQESYLLFLVPKFDFLIKRQELAPKKMYFIDTKLAQVVGFRGSPDSGRLLENCVFLELRRRGYTVFYFSSKNECDFVVKTRDGRWLAIQVTQEFVNPDTRAREIAGLLEAMDEFKLESGLILTLDHQEELQEGCNGRIANITILPTWKWFLL